MKRAPLVALLALLSCEDRVVEVPAPGQIVLHVDTDAPVASHRPRGPLDPAPLFDRLRVDVFAPGATEPCDGCTNEFELDEDLLRHDALSVGIAPTAGAEGFRARIRMFTRALRGDDGEADPDATLETVVALPAVAGTGKVDAAVTLRTDDVGHPVGTLDEPTAPDAWTPGASLVGTWERAIRVPCAAPPPAGMVCVPGGAYWMGDRRKVFAILPQYDANAPRLVVLSPFYLDAREVTVGEVRKEGITRVDASRNGADGSVLRDFCTTTEDPGPNEDVAVNCIRWAEARAYCKRRDADLPTEAQFEYVASGTQDLGHPWGEDEPTCDDAVFSRTGYGGFATILAQCRPAQPFGGPLPAGHGARDRLVLPTGTIVDLAGNVSEWQRDLWNRSDEPCWSRAGVLVDPVCNRTSPKDGELRAIRGGGWTLASGQLERTMRASAPTNVTLFDTGFRCMKPAQAAP